MVDSTWEDLINLNDVITQILDELEDGGIDENCIPYLNVIKKLGVTLNKSDAKELKKRIDSMEEDYDIPDDIVKVVNDALK